jgi:hypothetical protein
MTAQHEKTVFVQFRQEYEIIPEGVPCTEADAAWYISIRTKDTIRNIRIQKNKRLLFSTSLETRPLWKNE